MKNSKSRLNELLSKDLLEGLKDVDDVILIPTSEFTHKCVKDYIDMYNSMTNSSLTVLVKKDNITIFNKRGNVPNLSHYSVTKVSDEDRDILKNVMKYSHDQVWESLVKSLPNIKEVGDVIRVPNRHISIAPLRRRLEIYNLQNKTNLVCRQSSNTKDSYSFIRIDQPFYDTFDYQYTVNKANPNIVKRLDDLNIQEFVVNDSLFIPEDFIPSQMVRNYATACSKFVDCKFSVNKRKDGVIITRIC